MNTSNNSKKIIPANFDQAVIQPIAFSPADGNQRRKKLNIRPLSIMLATLLLFGAAVVWFLFTAKSVIVKTSPQTTDFTINGGLKFELSGHFVMREGAYQLTARHPGYYPLDVTIDVDERQNQVKTFEFKKLPGRLTVNTNDNISASVWIDQKKIGDSGVELSEIAAGEHQIKVEAQRYFSYTGTVDINGMDQLQQLSVILQPAWANVSLLSEPVGSQLTSDGQVVGETPFNGTLLQGEHQLTLSSPGYKDWQQLIKIEAGVDVNLARVYLQRSDGILRLNSTPEIASVMLDGKYLGVTPLNLTLTANQKHQLSLFKDGYQQLQQTINVPSGKEQKLSVTLKPQLGQVTIHANHEDALLYIDDRLMGRANQDITLTAKQHKVVIKKEGYADFETMVFPRAELQQIVNASLQTHEEARWTGIKTHIRSPVGATLKLFKPSDVFTMGASRREQGRRSNEISRRVALERPFYLGLKEVSNAQYRKFTKLHSSGHVKGNSLDNNNHPVVNISWKQAALFCNWLSEKEKLPPFYQVEDGEITRSNAQSNGYRLPTEAEWAWSTRYQDGQMLKYSWGDTLPPTPNSGNFGDRTSASLIGYIQASYNDKFAVTAPVGNFYPNDKGLYDLSGNAAEWIHDFYAVKTGMSLKIERDPLGNATGDHHVIRGSSWAHGRMTELRLSYRDYGTEPRNDVGFRLARFVDVGLGGDKE